MSGYYPHATGVQGYTSPRAAIGDRATWSQHFRNAGFYTARVSKIFHMGVPGGIEAGSHGADAELSWTERFNSQGPEWKAVGRGETLERNSAGRKPVMGGNTFVVVAAEGDDNVHSDGKTAAKAVQLLQEHQHEPFFLAVGFVRPHVPFVSPRSFHSAFSPEAMVLPEKRPGDWDDIPKSGINYKTSVNMQMDESQQKKAIAGYYAAVSFMDAQVGKVLDALETAGLADKTIPARLQGKDLSPILDNPNHRVRETAFCTAGTTKGLLLRDERWAFIQYGEDASGGIELYDTLNDPQQFTNLANSPAHAGVVDQFKRKLAGKLATVRDCDLRN